MRRRVAEICRRARRPAARHRAGRGADQAAAAARRSWLGSTSASACCRRRRPRPAGAPADAARRDRLELRPAGPRATAAARPTSAFAGGMDLEQAESVCGPADELGVDVLDGLAALVDQSLLRQVATTGEPRFRMLQTIRDFARERLEESGEADVIARRHAEAFLALAETRRARPDGARPASVARSARARARQLRAGAGPGPSSGDDETASRSASPARSGASGRCAATCRKAGTASSRPGLPGRPTTRSALRRALDAAGGIAYWRATCRRRVPFSTSPWRLHGSPATSVDRGRALQPRLPRLVIRRTCRVASEPSRRRPALPPARRPGRAGAQPVGSRQRPLLPRGLRGRSRGADRSRCRLAGARRQFGLGWALHTLGLAEFRLGRRGCRARDLGRDARHLQRGRRRLGDRHGALNFRALAMWTAIACGRADGWRGGRAGPSTGADLAAVIEQIEARAMTWTPFTRGGTRGGAGGRRDDDGPEADRAALEEEAGRRSRPSRPRAR